MRHSSSVTPWLRMRQLTCLLALAAGAGCSHSNAPASEAPLAGTSPAETAWMDKHARFNQAIEGLLFEGGMVEVVLPLEGDIDLAAQLNEDGEAHYNEARYVEAVATRAQAVRMAPEFVDAYFGLGRSLLAHGKVDLAAAAYRTALALDPSLIDARFNLAMALWMLDDPDAAIAEMAEVVQQAPQRSDAHERLAIWNYYAGDNAAAWQHVHAAQAQGHQMPPQFLALLEASTPDPGGSGQ